MKNYFKYPIYLFIFIGLAFPQIGHSENGQFMFVAEMNAKNEVPSVRSDASGLITFLISEDRTEIFVHGAFANLTGNIIGCHIHKGASDTTGPVFIDLGSLITGNRIKGAVKVPAGFFALAMISELYVNVHTSIFPSGEIRGQLDWKAEIIIPAILSSYDEVPSIASNAIGIATFRFSQHLSQMKYQIAFTGLTGPPKEAHIHSGVPGVIGPVITPLNISASNKINGTINDPLIVEEIFFNLAFGMAYVNVHTDSFPKGEIRGQLVYESLNNGSAVMNGDQETPPVTTTAYGYGYASLNYPSMDTMLYAVLYDGIIPSIAHVHQAVLGKGGPAIFPLRASSTPGFYFGRAAVNADQRTAFFKDELYFNIHSMAHPNGEIRGQIINNLTKSFAFDMCGDQEVNPKNVNGYGAAYAAVNKDNTELEYGIMAIDLNGDATSAHIHDAKFGVNGNIMVPLGLPNPYISEVLQIQTRVGNKMDADSAYFNVHTAANPAGEIRGQVRRVLSCKINVGNLDYVIREARINTISNQLIVLETELDENMEAKLFINDVAGNQIAGWNAKFVAGFNSQTINIDHFSSGFYFLNIVDKDHTVKTLKFIKQ